jgi:hypothetical protein
MRNLAEAAEARRQHFFYILIREPLKPKERGERYEDPLSAALGELGEVTGGGSQLGKGKTIEYCGIDVVVNDREHGLRVIRRCLRSQGAADDTVIEEYVPQFKELPLEESTMVERRQP